MLANGRIDDHDVKRYSIIIPLLFDYFPPPRRVISASLMETSPLSELRAWHMTRLQKKHNFYVPSLDGCGRDAMRGRGRDIIGVFRKAEDEPHRRVASLALVRRDLSASPRLCPRQLISRLAVSCLRFSTFRGRPHGVDGSPLLENRQNQACSRIFTRDRPGTLAKETTRQSAAAATSRPLLRPLSTMSLSPPLPSPRRPSSRPLPFSLGIK